MISKIFIGIEDAKRSPQDGELIPPAQPRNDDLKVLQRTVVAPNHGRQFYQRFGFGRWGCSARQLCVRPWKPRQRHVFAALLDGEPRNKAVQRWRFGETCCQHGQLWPPGLARRSRSSRTVSKPAAAIARHTGFPAFIPKASILGEAVSTCARPSKS